MVTMSLLLSGKTCAVLGCERPHYARGMCYKHWQRARRHGDPHAIKVTTHGASKWWLDMVLAHADTDDCIDFPFPSRDTSGYGRLWIEGRLWAAHVYVCTRAHGERPDGMEVCHSCHRGADGCVNPSHLRWDTHQNNMIERGVVLDIDEEAIRADGRSQQAIADEYGISQMTVSRIKRGVR